MNIERSYLHLLKRFLKKYKLNNVILFLNRVVAPKVWNLT